MSLASDAGRSHPLTVVCVGTDRSTGDSLGPLVGTMLSWGKFPGTVLGDLESPVHAENLYDAVARLAGSHGLVLGVDACLGTRQEVGGVMVRAGPLRPGLGVKKKLLPIGDLYIAGVVNVGGFMEYMVLQNTRLSLVMRMAQAIASGILKADALLRSARDKDRPEPTLHEEAPILVVPGNDGLQSPLLQAFAHRR
ncbi:MAG: spore protease YyaC [Bacillota bacterium]